MLVRQYRWYLCRGLRLRGNKMLAGSGRGVTSRRLNWHRLVHFIGIQH
jgi:hypothetical protein